MASDGGWVRAQQADGRWTISAGGTWDIGTAAVLDRELMRLPAVPPGTVILDLSAIERMDTAGAWLLHRTASRFEAHGVTIEATGTRPPHRILLEQIGQFEGPPEMARRDGSRFLVVAERMGRATVWTFNEGADLLAFLGQCIVTAGKLVLRPRRIRLVSLLSHIEQVGANALPIVGLLSFMIGVVLAFQGADQLRRFGADIFTVNLLGISILREMGILLAAIIVAGRSGSAFTAHIGTMQVNEEIDAMRTIGLDPIEVLVLPRILALVIVMPLLAVYADFMGLMGGALMSITSLDISLVQFLERLKSSISLWSFWVGVIKAPVFGLLIAIVGCHEGLRVSGGAESVGKQTTRAVVVSIFLVIVGDAFFSIFFSIVGV